MSDLPPIEYGRPNPEQPTRLVTPAGVVLLVAAVALVLWLASQLTAGPRHREMANRVKCAANLRLIGQAMLLYAQDYGGISPPDLQAVAVAEDIGLEVLVCPSSNDNPAPTTQSVSTGGVCSYVYVGTGITNRGNPSQIAMIEDPANHNLEGGNVLFGDGHVEFMDLPTMQLFLNELNARHNPPRTMTPNMSQTAARQDYARNWKARMPQLNTGVWQIPSMQAATRPGSDGSGEEKR